MVMVAPFFDSRCISGCDCGFDENWWNW